MKRILFLAHRIPYPPNKGDKIRSFKILKQLCESHKVYLAAFIDEPMDWGFTEKLSDMCEDTLFIERPSWGGSWSKLLSAFLLNHPLSTALYHSEDLRLWIRTLLHNVRIDAVYIYSSVMAKFIDFGLFDGRKIVDFVDVDSQKWKQIGSQSSSIKKYIYKREASTLLDYERHVAQFSDINLFVSNKEAELFKTLIKDNNIPIQSISNGVDCKYFDPSRNYPNPYKDHKDCKVLVFTGAMDYWPNVDAMIWFVNQIFKPILKLDDKLMLYIVGSKPSSKIFDLQEERIVVTSRVADVRPYLKFADLAVVPLRVARGVQNKILEAMCMNLPVVATPAALEGLELISGPNVWSLQSSGEWRDKILDIMDGTTSIVNMSNREQILSNYTWEKPLKELMDCLE